jgi:hypothetical protein
MAIMAIDHNPTTKLFFDSHRFDGKISSSHSTIETLIGHSRAFVQRATASTSRSCAGVSGFFSGSIDRINALKT